MFGLKKSKMASMDAASRVAVIKALSAPDTKKKKKKGQEDENFNLLLRFLTDESPEFRIAAAEALGQTSREIAVTYLCNYIQKEKDEQVIEAMKKALASIRANMREDR